ncbi:MAG: hypothetical protein AAB726_02015 [Patescibacteria group bacterium]
MLVFLTNASTPQYRLDLLNVCCFPPDAVITFDYRICWLDDSISNHDAPHWVGRTAIIIYYDPHLEQNGETVDFSVPDKDVPESGGEVAEFEFYPIRLRRATACIHGTLSSSPV